MKNKSIYFFLALFTTFIITSCSSDDDGGTDTVPPTIAIIEPHDDDVFAPGDFIEIEIEFTDNVALASYKIDIHYSGDGHSHDLMGGFQWEYEESGTLSGTSQTVTTSVQIPEFLGDIAIEEGAYHFGVYCLDAAGNETVVWQMIEVDTHAGHDLD